VTQSRVKTICYVLEGISAFATAYYGSYVYFHTQTHLGFGRAGNLSLSALSGLVYIIGSFYGGRFSQRIGYFGALKLGFFLKASALAAGLFLPWTLAQVLVLLVWTQGMSLIWPSLEALVSEGEDWSGLKQRIGVYNVVWAAASASAFFIGGALLERLGWKSLFWLPMSLHLLQLVILIWLRKQVVTRSASLPSYIEHPRDVPPDRGRAFLRMAWLANPLAYVAINSLIPQIPDLAASLKLSPMMAGFVCSVFYLARLGAFVGLWLWPGWHYRFSWLAGAYVALLVSYAVVLSAPQLLAIIIAQVVFGGAIGLLYYSSLFYSMDLGDAKGEHGGLHEAAIGSGLFVGPAISASALYFFPQTPHSGMLAVCGLLFIGGCALVRLNCSRTTPLEVPVHPAATNNRSP
jgi:predicted MFS family arabinose efflux permease